MAASRQRDGIVLAKLDGAASQADSLGALLPSIGHPAVDLAPDMAPRRHRMGRREIRIDLQRLTELAQRLVGSLPGSAIDVRPSAQVVVVGVEAVGRLALRTLELGLLQLRCDLAHDAHRDLVLQIEDVLQPAVKPLRPEMDPRLGIDELRGYANAARRLAHTPFEDERTPSSRPTCFTSTARPL